jgi:AbrB family looped-hinge helix DNA binding protein
MMTIVKISPKYQVVIPKEIRNRLKLRPGQKMQIFQYDERIEFIPLKNIKEARGFLKGIDTNIAREEDRL